MRATPLDAKSPSAAELLLGRPVATTLPAYTTIQRHNSTHNEQMREKQAQSIAYANAHTKPLRELIPQQPVQILDTARKTWFPATVAQNLGNRSYSVRTDNGTILRRNRQHIRTRNVTMEPIPEPETASVVPPTPMTTPALAPVTTPVPPDMPPGILKQTTTRTGRTVKRPVRFRDE